MSARIIFFEGSDCVGKSIQIKLMRDKIINRGFTVKCLKEPGSTRRMEDVRKILLDKEMNKEEELSYLSRRLLYAADHAQLIDTINKIKDKYDVILVDRYTLLSDFVYGPMLIKDQHKFTISTLINECYEEIYKAYSSCPIENACLILITIDDEELTFRDKQRNLYYNDSNIFDDKSLQFKLAVNRAYNFVAEKICSEDYSSTLEHIFKHFSKVEVIKGNLSEIGVLKNIIEKLEIGWL